MQWIARDRRLRRRRRKGYKMPRRNPTAVSAASPQASALVTPPKAWCLLRSDDCSQVDSSADDDASSSLGDMDGAYVPRRSHRWAVRTQPAYCRLIPASRACLSRPACTSSWKSSEGRTTGSRRGVSCRRVPLLGRAANVPRILPAKRRGALRKCVPMWLGMRRADAHHSKSKLG